MGEAGLTWATITGALSNIWDVVDSCIENVAQNPLLLTMLCAGLIPVGFRIFRKARRSVGA